MTFVKTMYAVLKIETYEKDKLDKVLKEEKNIIIIDSLVGKYLEKSTVRVSIRSIYNKDNHASKFSHSFSHLLVEFFGGALCHCLYGEDDALPLDALCAFRRTPLGGAGGL